ncbi:hypothetical protein TrST_g10667 [Triparma strigata]|uniref:Uncharacterized protein n=1 Tax=Triparma strigata TaxID=1606541 RepID=A0A9W7EZL3_9STRA|nr:hypothetical protein TrST_g10667 [Triparma strigata]
MSLRTFRSPVEWDTIFWSYCDNIVTIEFEKVDVFQQWEKKGLGGGFKDWIEEGGGKEDSGDELEDLVSSLSDDVLYEGSEYWRSPFLLHPTTITSDPDLEEGTINVDEYVEELMGGKEIDMEKVEKEMFETGISGEMEREGKKEGWLEEIED